MWNSKDLRFFDSVEVLTEMFTERTQSIKKYSLVESWKPLSCLLSQPCQEQQLLLYYICPACCQARPVDRSHLISSKCYRFRSYLCRWSILSWFCVCYKVEIQIHFLYTDTQIHRHTHTPLHTYLQFFQHHLIKTLAFHQLTCPDAFDQFEYKCVKTDFWK